MFKSEASQTAGILLFDSCPCHFSSLCHRASPSSDLMVLSTEGHTQLHAHILCSRPPGPYIAWRGRPRALALTVPSLRRILPSSSVVQTQGSWRMPLLSWDVLPLSSFSQSCTPPPQAEGGVQLGLGRRDPCSPAFLDLGLPGAWPSPRPFPRLSDLKKNDIYHRHCWLLSL